MITTREALSNFINNPWLPDACHSLIRDYFEFSADIEHSGTSGVFDIEEYVGDEFVQKHEDLCQKCPSFVYLGAVDEDSFSTPGQTPNLFALEDKQQDHNYTGFAFFGIEPKEALTKTELAQLTRAFNKGWNVPVILFVKHNKYLSLATCERSKYVDDSKEGEKLGKVTILKDINCENPHRGHSDILESLNVKSFDTFDELYHSWLVNFNISTLNKKFYTELQEWFYWATDAISLPCKLTAAKDVKHFKQNFLVRLLSRLMFCWFLKEKKDQNGNSIIDSRYLELIDRIHNRRYPILKNVEAAGFLDDGSYYLSVLQNIFFCALNSDTKKDNEDFVFTQFLNDDFDYSVFERIPFLNGSTFRPVEDDFFNASGVNGFLIPNKVFYGEPGHHGINEIFMDYKFTIEENTPEEEDIALDPELLGMVFENLLAEIDPQNDENTAKSIRNATGSFYTPRPVIQEMTNETLVQYLLQRLVPLEGANDLTSIKRFLHTLVYNGIKTSDSYDKVIVDALYKIRVLDPACGSGAFPMGMLQRIVELLRIVDPTSDTWLSLMLEPITDNVIREQFRKQLSGSTSDYQRKLGIIRNCIYAIDIQPIAVQITKLRFFISLLADQDIDTTMSNCGILPFPNLETKIICADSLKNIQVDIFSEKSRIALVKARQKYYQPNFSPTERDGIAEEIAIILSDIFPSFASFCGLRTSNKAALKRWFLDANLNAPFFDMYTFFPEITDGFDVVIGNPPYGGFKISQEVRDALGLGSNDPYGAFISRFLGDGERQTPLKDGGMLAFIVSDTFMTIGTHLELRKQMMKNRIHKMICMSPKTFSATVNTVTIFCEKCKAHLNDSQIDGNICTMADMTNIDIHEDFQHFVDVLTQSMDIESDECIANTEYAIYRYPQALIKKSSNQPFFVASPKLFALMCDLKPFKKENIYVNGHQVLCKVMNLNGKLVPTVRFGDIADVKVGLQTGDNPAYLYQNPEARGTYRDINLSEKFILTDDDLKTIHSDEDLRLSIITNGISKNDKNSKRYFGGRFIVRYDKGGESDAEGGWLPNYHVPTDFFIDWSEQAVHRMQTLTIRERDRANGVSTRSQTPNKVCSRFQNSSSYFKKGVSFSWTGKYSPTFRIGEGGPFDHGASSAFFSDDLSAEYVTGVLASKLERYLMRTMINHTVNFGVDDVKDIIFPKETIASLEELVISIISAQKKDRYYDYASHEQIQIDKLVYEAFGLNEGDIEEVENWYIRRYPKLAKAQQENLRVNE